MLLFDHVSYRYPGADGLALDDVSLALAPGERLVLLGANGSGKSTLVRLANAMLLPTGGSVSADGMDTRDEATTRALRTAVGVVAQDPETQIVSSTLIDEVAFGPENLGLPRDEIAARVKEAVTAVGLAGKETREPHSLSGGEKQRLVIAGILAMRPRYMVLDEPCSMLDAQGREEVEQLIASLHAQGHGILQITHDLSECAAADKVVVLAGGRIVFEGGFDELLAEDELLEARGVLRPLLLELAAHLQEAGVKLPANPMSPRALAGAVVLAARAGAGSVAVPRDADEDGSAGLPRMRQKIEGGQAGMVVEGPAAMPEMGQGGARPTSLVLEQVSYEYASGTTLAHRALEDVSLCIEPAQSVLVMGVTGSGKSTLLRLAAGLIEPSQGSVLLDGHKLLAGEVGMSFQQPEMQLFAETVAEDIAFGMVNKGVGKQKALAQARELMERIGLPPSEFATRSPFSLSGGQARRVAVAGMLACGPAYLLFDEPTAGLDARGRSFIQDLLADLRGQGRGIVVVSHDIDEFLPVVDRVVLLSEGRIVWQGPAAVLVGDPRIFRRAGLGVPALLEFEEHLGCMPGSFTMDVEQVAQWALTGFGGVGPMPHAHGGEV